MPRIATRRVEALAAQGARLHGATAAVAADVAAHLVLAEPLRFGDGAWQTAGSAAFADHVSGCPAAPGAERVQIPGEPEALKQAASATAVDMTDAAWRLFANCARQAGLDPAPCLADADG